jgi:hypothetical protein
MYCNRAEPHLLKLHLARITRGVVHAVNSDEDREASSEKPRGVEREGLRTVTGISVAA